MSDRDQSTVDALRQEEYIGENRCLPCTAVNVILGAVVAFIGGAAVKRALGRTAGRLTALILAGVFGALIYLRGYLVPGTPELTKRYLPQPVLKLFGKEPGTDTEDLAFGDQIDDRIEADIADEQSDTDNAQQHRTQAESKESGEQSPTSVDHPSDTSTVENETDPDDENEAVEIEITDVETDAAATTEEDGNDPDESAATESDGDATSEQDEGNDADEWETVEKVQYRREHSVDPEQFLNDTGVVEPCENRDDVCLTDAFATDVDDYLEAYDSREDVDLELLGELFEESPADIELQDREYPTYKVGFRIRKWPTNGALFVDLATHKALRDRSDDWLSVPLEQRANILESLRSFLTACPSCDGDLRFSETAVESCCGAHEVIAYKCHECDQHLVELTPSKIGDGKTIEP